MDAKAVINAILDAVSAGKADELGRVFEKYPDVGRAIEGLVARPDSKPRQDVLAEEIECSGLLDTGGVSIDNSGSLTINVGGNFVGGNLTTNESKPRDYRSLYLEEIAAETRSVALSGLDDPEYVDPRCGKAVRLADVYTALDTAEMKRADTEEDHYRLFAHLKKTGRISAQEMVNRKPHLVFLGVPGSGKSTLVNFLSFVLAKAALDQNPEAWLDRLKQNGPWELGPLFPVRVILRDFAAQTDVSRKKGNAELLEAYLKNWLHQKGWDEFWGNFQRGLYTPETPYLILLDGLDEVPETQRAVIVESIDAFAGKYDRHRYLVTCRTYAYIGRNYLKGFPQAALMPFNAEQINRFIMAWYQELRRLGRLPQQEADYHREKLASAVKRPELAGMAENPLLLTVMVLLQMRHQLPENRVELYRAAVDLMLQRWESRISGEQGLRDALGMQNLKIADLEAGLYHVAFKVQEKSAGKDKTADISKADLIETLHSYLDNDRNTASKFLAYIRERAGLLIPHKNDTYTFPHLTFQEYMAACHLVKQPTYVGESARLLRESPDRWRIVYVLAAGFLARNQFISHAVSAINKLFPFDVEQFKKAKTPDAAEFRLAAIAGEALIEMARLANVSRDDDGKAVLERIKYWLLAAMQADDVLVPKERVEAGNILAELGTPRFDPGNWYLPFEPVFGFKKIERGQFMMGSDKKRDKEASGSELPSHPVKYDTYYIARYPVTVAQFGAFLNDSPYQMDEKWKEYNRVANHPVCYVSWDDAKAYCHWLNEKMKDRGLEVCLPSEAQWERAARGTDGRIYPYGYTADPNRANYSDTKIGGTSPVGCFPGGESLDGLSDMSGNVWEWVEDDWHANYKGAPESGIAWVDKPRGAYRVYRGGSWYHDAWYCRSACRNFNSPGYRFDDLGFRLALALALSRGQQVRKGKDK